MDPIALSSEPAIFKVFGTFFDKRANETQGLFHFIFSYYVEISLVLHYLK